MRGPLIDNIARGTIVVQRTQAIYSVALHSWNENMQIWQAGGAIYISFKFSHHVVPVVLDVVLAEKIGVQANSILSNGRKIELTLWKMKEMLLSFNPI